MSDKAIVSGLTGAERETVVVANEGEEFVTIDTTVRKHITRLRKDARFTEVASGYYGTTEYASFRIRRDEWNPVSGAKRRVTMTDERRAELAERLKKARP